jgi:hypothetical protein
MLIEMRDAIASRQATLEDLRDIADRYGRNLPAKDADAAQWARELVRLLQCADILKGA